MISIRNILKNLIANGIFAVSSLSKLSFIFGSQMAFFSAFNIVGPLAGTYVGLPLLTSIFTLRYLIKALFIGNLLNPFIFQIPTFFGALYWATHSRVLRCLIPSICMFLFLAHPIGYLSFYYSLFWFIPFSIALSRHQSIFLNALASTFTAHAVGSVLWLYWMPLQPETYLSLMPVVVIERLIFATGMTLVYYLIEYTTLVFSDITKFGSFINEYTRKINI